MEAHVVEIDEKIKKMERKNDNFQSDLNLIQSMNQN